MTDPENVEKLHPFEGTLVQVKDKTVVVDISHHEHEIEIPFESWLSAIKNKAERCSGDLWIKVKATRYDIYGRPSAFELTMWCK